MKKILIILIYCFWNSYTPTLGQLAYLSKIIIPHTKDIDESHQIIPLAEKGLLLLKFQDKSEKQNTTKMRGKPLLISKIDTNLTTQWNNKYIIPFSYFNNQTLQYYHEEKNNRLYILVIGENKKKFVVFKLNIDTGIMEIFEGKSPVSLGELKEFKVLNDTMFAFGTLNYRSVAFSFNFIEKIIRFIPSFYAKNQDILSMHLEEEQNTVYFIILDQKKYYLSIKPYSTVLGLGKEITLRHRNDYTLKNALIYTQNDKQQLVIGTYVWSGGEYLQGIYTTQLDNNKQENIIYHPFSDLRCFFNHYTPTKISRIKNRIKKKKEKGKSLYLSYNISTSTNPFSYQGNLIFTFENYFIDYRQSNFTSMRGYAGLGQVFDGYVKRYSAIVCMDKKGNILWDNIIKIDDAKQQKLEPLVKLATYADSLVMSYAKDDKLYSKMIHKYNVIQEETSQKVADIFHLDRKDDFENNQLYAWYKNYFILTGTQRKKLPLLDEPDVKFLYLSKIRYQHNPNNKTEATKRKER